jgi:nitroimidazol reductase NimA-like FMN-containing flavoprotein (pyridoxamine 5'-phosphate oxidase superfamily)
MSASDDRRIDRAACAALLAANPVGRVAVRHGREPVIAPIRFAVAGDDVVFLAAPGPLLDAAVMGARVAVQIDGTSEDGTPWTVLAVGHAHEVTEPAERRRLLTPALTSWSDRPCEHVVRVRVDRLVGERGAGVVIDLATAERGAETRHRAS